VYSLDIVYDLQVYFQEVKKECKIN